MSVSSGTGRYEPFYRLTADDRGPVIVIVVYSWICFTSIVALVRFSLAWNQRLRFRVDDGTFLLSVVFAITSSACFHAAVDSGLGRRIVSVPENSLFQYHRMMYAAELCGVIAMASAKSSVVLLSDRVAPRSRRQYWIMISLIMLWAIFAIFATAFQCPLPHPLVTDPSRCASGGSVQYPIIILNILTDAFLAMWILPTLRKLLMDTGKRVTVMILFGSRIIVCLPAILQLVSVARHSRAQDFTFSSFGRALWGICTIHLSVLLATIPRTNRFITALQSMHTTTQLTEYELSSSVGGSYALSKGKGSLSTSGVMASTNGPDHSDHQEPPNDHNRSRSPSRSNRSQEPLVELNLTPSVDQAFSTEITSQENSNRAHDKKYQIDDWRKYMRRNRHEDQTMDVATMFSWKSRSSNAERIMQTTEVTQEVEIVEPRESRWVLSKVRRVSRDAK